MRENTNVSYVTKRIGSPRWALLIVCLLAMVTDVIVLAFFALGGYNGYFYLFPVLLLVVDTAFFVLNFFINYRFRYSILHLALFCLAEAGMVAVTAVFGMGTMQQHVATLYAGVLWLAVHGVAVLVATVLAALHAAKRRCVYGKGIALAMLLLLAAATAYYGYFVQSNGFFGQGAGELRTLIYRYDERTDSYHVDGVLEGRGDTVVIPETFNDRKVTSVNCSVFNAGNVTTVRLDCAADTAFVNTAAIRTTSPDLAIYAEKDSVNDLRTFFYTLAAATDTPDEAMLSVANRIYPDGLAENEVFVAYHYDAAAFTQVDEQPLPVWIGQRGDTLRLDEHFAAAPYLSHDDVTSDSDLHWADRNFGGSIFTGVYDGENKLNGTRIEDSVRGAHLAFERVYRVTVGSDNDTLYETDNAHRASLVNGSYLAHKYLVRGTADGFQQQIPTRTGFDLRWQYRAGSAGSRQMFTHLSDILGEVRDITIYPLWSLHAPEVSLTADRESYVYGDNVRLTSVATAPVTGLQLSYAWSKSGGNVSGTASALTLTTPVPQQSGTYTVTVTASSDTLTSLASEASASVTVSIGKKPLHVTWDVPEGPEAVYSGTNKQVNCELVPGQQVGNDELTFSQTISTVRDARSYTARITLTGETSTKYTVAAGEESKTFSITPYALTLTWEGETFTYDGKEQAPVGKAYGVGEENASLVPLTYDGEQKDVGHYTVTARPNSANYTLTNPTKPYEIRPRVIDIGNWSERTFTYNGRAQRPTVTSVTGAVSGEEDMILSTLLRYSDNGKVNAGSHTVTVTLAAGNYAFVGQKQTDYEIGRKGITLVWGSSSLEYSGREQGAIVRAIEGQISGEDSLVRSQLSLNAGNVNVGEGYTRTATLSPDSNYVITEGASCEYDITKRKITLAIGSVEKNYDGQPAHFDFVLNGLVGSDVRGEVVTTFSFAGCSAEGAKDVGEYEIDGSITGFGSKAGNYEIAIEKGTLLIRQRNITLVWEERAFTYNGGLQRPTVTSIEGAVSGEEDEILRSIQYDGGGINAGSHTVTASTGNKNYAITTSASKTYTIGQASLTLVWGESEFTYDGQVHRPTVNDVTGAVSGEKDEILRSIQYDGDGSESLGSHTVTASLANGNYIITNSTKEFTIVLPPVPETPAESEPPTGERV